MQRLKNFVAALPWVIATKLNTPVVNFRAGYTKEIKLGLS